MAQTRIPVAILGATGTVGQKAIRLLDNHPRFQVAEVSASDKRAGCSYAAACNWREERPLPNRVAQLTLIRASEVQSPYVLSALPGAAATEIEQLLAARGQHVISNASAHRMQPDVPLLVPEINASELALLERQATPGKIVTNPNCVVAVVAPALAPLLQLGTIEHVGVATLQAISGAGYPGLSSLDILGNVIPHIEGEESKIEQETAKILGKPVFAVTAQVHRVPVNHGHLAALQIRFQEPVSLEAAQEAYRARSTLFCVHRASDAPQPARHLTEDDMRVHIGRLRAGSAPNILCLVALGHNLVRGAAGAAIANLEATEQFLRGGES